MQDNHEEPKLLDTIENLLALAEISHIEGLGEAAPLKASAGDESHFKAFFGRDSIRAALDMLYYHPEVAHKTIIGLCELQGTDHNERAEEEPGKIHHEHRVPGDRIRAELEKSWDFPYYGTMDATPNFIYLTCKYGLKNKEILSEGVTNKRVEKLTVLDSLSRALKYMLDKISESPGGFLEWKKTNPNGIDNQAWKDSWDSYHHGDGMMANHDSPIAGIEIQGYAHNALRKTVELFDKFSINPSDHGLPPLNIMEDTAASLAKSVLDKFWLEDKKYFALGLDLHQSDEYHQLDIVTSNPGHLLDTEIFRSPRRVSYLQALISGLFAPSMLSLSGIRTLSKAEKLYRPGSYHNGSVWPFDNGIIADGLRRYGYICLAHEIEYRVLSAVHKTGSHYEFFRGDPETGELINTSEVHQKFEDGTTRELERLPQMNQAWTVTRTYIIERRLAEDFYLKQKLVPKDDFEREIIKRSEFLTSAQIAL